jgi:hypothetical protein
MRPATENGVEQWLSRRAQVAIAVVAWAGGSALAGVAGWHMQHPTMAFHATAKKGASVTAAMGPLGDVNLAGTANAPELDDTLEAEGATVLLFPDDVIVATRSRVGVTQMQKR